ncbi:hypothetical protein FRC11_012717 [Ceratobasidium sp. 423]|nr:hypothetical protein FRC11_012717 [Ceratobasidium sp. 423]
MGELLDEILSSQTTVVDEEEEVEEVEMSGREPGATHAKSTKAGDVKREVVNEESLRELTFDVITEEVQENAPTLCGTDLISHFPRIHKY